MIVEEFEKSKAKRNLLSVEPAGFDVEVEAEIINLFYKLFNNFSSRTHRTDIKVRNKLLVISQVGFMLRNPTAQRGQTLELLELIDVFRQHKKIMPYLKVRGKSSAKGELFAIWRDILLKDMPEFGYDLKIPNKRILDEFYEWKSINKLKFRDERAVELWYNADCVLSIDLDNLDEIEEWQIAEQVQDEIEQLLRNISNGHKALNKRMPQMLKELKEKCSKWLIMLNLKDDAL